MPEKTSTSPVPVREGGCLPNWENRPVICFREKENGGWLNLTILTFADACQRRFPVVTSWPVNNGEDVAIAFEVEDGRVEYALRQNGQWSTTQLLSSNGAAPALTNLNDQPYAIWTEADVPPYRILQNGHLLSAMATATEAPHRRRLYFRLRESLIGGQGLPIDGDVILEIGDPVVITPDSVHILPPLYRRSQVTGENGFYYQDVQVSHPQARLEIPLRIVAQNLRRMKGKENTPPPLPLLGLRLKDRGTGQVVRLLGTYQTSALIPDSTGRVEIADTVSVELGALVGRRLRLEGQTFFRKGGKAPRIAEVYEVGAPSSAPQAPTLAGGQHHLEASPVKEFVLHPNYPNPFNPVTNVEFGIGNAEFGMRNSEWVTLKIYDILGREVKTLVNRRLTAGRYTVQWDGTDDLGKPVTSGVYLYRLQAGEHVLTRKMVLMK